MTLTWPWSWGDGLGYCWIKLWNYIYHHTKYKPIIKWSGKYKLLKYFNVNVHAEANADDADDGGSAIALPGLRPGELKTQRCKDSEMFFYHLSTVLSTSVGKTLFFIRRFIPNKKQWFMIDNIIRTRNHLSFLFLNFVFKYIVFTAKLIFMAKSGSDLWNFYNKLEFWIYYFFYLNYFLLFFTNFKWLMFHNNTVQLSEILNKWNLLKTCIKTTHQIEFCIFCSRFCYEKNANRWMF